MKFYKRRGDVSKVDMQCLRVGEIMNEPGKYLLDWMVRGKARVGDDFVERLDVVVDQRGGRLRVRSITTQSRTMIPKEQKLNPELPNDSSGKPVERI